MKTLRYVRAPNSDVASITVTEKGQPSWTHTFSLAGLCGVSVSSDRDLELIYREGARVCLILDAPLSEAFTNLVKEARQAVKEYS